MPQGLIDKRIKELAEKCKKITDERGLYIINQDDYRSLNYNQLKNVTALIEKDGKHICQFQQSSLIFETRHNPNYDINESVKKTNDALVKNIDNQQKNDDRSYFALMLSACASVISLGVVMQDIACNSTQRELQQQVESLKKIDSTLLKLVEKVEKAKEDTLNVSLTNGLSSKTNQPNSK